jgi:gamma-glutamyl phosphate reductase
VNAVPHGLDEWLALNRRRAEREVTAHIDRVNQLKDRVDEALDAERIHGGMTLDEFLASR